jgi:lipoprotein-anchoring transpeptidase ErfK/SrfK
MVDYYSILLRAVTAPNAGDGAWRHAIYARSRQMLASQIRARRPSTTMAEIAAEQADLEEAIGRIEAELAWTERGAAADDADVSDRGGDITEGVETEGVETEGVEADRGPLAAPSRLGRPAWIVIAVVAAALGASGYIIWSGTSHQSSAAQKSAPAAVKSEAQTAAPLPVHPLNVAKNGELAPGIDGGSSDADLPYVLRRQPTFYRTLQPAGTIIVDKQQHYLYLIEPNNVALRYGIALGEQCTEVAGLRHVASMTEWPPWQPPPDLLKRNPALMPGIPGNPLGARLLALDDGSSRIHGTNAPKTIGNAVAFGCIRLMNDDIVDLYSRVKVSTPVVVN